MNDAITQELRPTDSELLNRFVTSQDKDAFRELVDKHSGMVWRICARQLRRPEDIEDAFQTTFVTLAKKARTVKKGSSVASWLYKVAYNHALQIIQARSRRAEQTIVEEPETMDNVFAELQDREQAMILDEEVSRLPKQLRSVVVLCLLEGKSRSEAAEELECTDASVKSRLTRGRRLLRMRLARRGIGLTVVLALLTKTVEHAGAAPPASILEAAFQAGVQTVPEAPLWSLGDRFGNGFGGEGWALRAPFTWVVAFAIALFGGGAVLLTQESSDQNTQAETQIELPEPAEPIEDKINAVLLTLEQEDVGPDDPRLNHMRVQREVYEQQAIAKGLEIEAYLARGTKRADELNERIAKINQDALKKFKAATEQLAEFAIMKGLWNEDEATRVLADRNINAAMGMDDARMVANMAAKLQAMELPGDKDPVLSRVKEVSVETRNETQPNQEKQTTAND